MKRSIPASGTAAFFARGTRFVASAIFASFTFAAAQTANAKDFYWTGKTNTKFENTDNWTVSGSNNSNTLPYNDGLIVDKSKLSGSKNTTMVFASAVVNNWKNWIRNVGTETDPFVFKGSQAAYGITVGDTSSEGWYIASESNDSGNAYVRFDTGTFATGEGDTKAVWKIGGTSREGHVTVNGATINSPGVFYLQRGSLTVNSGTVTVNGDFRLGDVRAVTLTVNGGTMYAGAWTRLENSSAGNYNKTINLNGGEMHTATITVIGGGGTKTVNFNGGTLKNTYVNATHGLIDTGVAVKIKAGGGTIDTNAKAPVIVPDMNEDASSPGGGMTFKGGGSVTLAGAIGWTGGTTIEAGTTVKVDTAAKKDALLGSGLNTLKVIPASAGTHTLVTITGEDTFTDADLRKASLSTGAGTFSLSNDGKSLVVEISYAGGEINQTTPTLVFPGAALADLATHTIRARMAGNNFDADGTEATFFKISDDGTKATYQLQALDDTSSHHYTKAVKVEFTADVSGVYAKLIDGNYANYGNPGQFGTDPLTTNPGKSSYIPYDFRLVEPATAISVNFTRSGTNLDTSSSVRYGAGDYAVPYSSWNNMAAANNGTDTFGGATVKITKTSGAYGCSNLNGAKDVRHGYLDDGGLTVVVEVTNIPYEFYRMVTYHSTDNADIKFGHVTINGVNYTGTTDATVKGNATWGATGAGNYSFGLREGVNYLVSDVMTASSATITGHRDKSSGPTARGCIAAIQIVEYKPTTYTATIGDGGDKTFSALDWDKALPAALTAGDQVVLNVNEDTTLTLDSALDVYAIKFNVAAGKTLTLAGQNVAAQYITATGAGQTVVGSATRLAGTVKGDGTLVYSGAAPSGVAFTDAAWEGVLWLKNGTMNGLLAQDLAKENSTLRLTGVTGYFNNGDSEMTSEGALELVDDGSTPAFTVSNGYSTSGKTVFAALTGDGTFKADTTTAQRYVFKDVSAFTGTIDIPSGNNTRVILGDGASLAPATGTISVAAGATATVAAGKTWVANGGMIVNGTLMLGTGATAPAVVSGTGAVGVASGTGTLAGYGANAVLELATAPGATLAIADAALESMTIGALTNYGTIDLTGTALAEATLNLASGVTAAATGTILYPATFQKFVVSPADQSVRSLADFTTLPTLPEGVAYYVAVAETREEFGKGLLEVADCAAGVNVRVARPDGTFADVAPVNGVATLEGVHIAGAATAFDFTYTNTAEKAYSAPGLTISLNADTLPLTFNNNNADKTTGAYIKHHPWVEGAGSLITLDNFTIVLVGRMSPSHNTQFFHMGTTTDQNKGILITTTENDDEVLIAKNTGSAVDAANGVKASVPNAATERHAYVIKKKGTIVEVWVDGVKRGQFDGGEGFALPSSGGMQVGSDHGGKIRGSGVYNAVANTDDETGYLNVLRMFDYSITDAQAEAVFAEYPYVSQGGLYTRTVSSNAAFSQTDAWAKENDANLYAVPAGATVDDVFYNPSATLEVGAAAVLTVNADVALENLTVGGSAALTFAADGSHTVSVLGAAIVNSPATIAYGALYLAGAPLQLGSSGSICFDCSAADFSDVYAVTRFQLTGLVDRDDAKFSLVPPSDANRDRSYEIVYNTTGSCYDLVVTPLHNYVVVENRVVDSPSLTEDNIIVGAGGFDIETLSIPDNARFVYDPVKTPIHVYGWTDGAFTVGEGAKLALSADYAGTTLGRIVLCIYKEECAVLPADLNDIFDSSSIAPGATWAVTSEDAPDPSGGRKQLVLTVGDYANDAKEIRILPVGDSITQGVYIENSGDAQDRYPQYRSTIAARLAAQGYKPKMLGVWKRANYDAAHTMIPEDWAWHCGLNAERIVAGGNRGGVRDNMHVYLDIAGDVNVVTLLIGTNDIGAGATGEETYNEFTNVVFAIAAQRPGAKIIGATILDRSGDENKAQIAAFNALLKADNAAGNLPANFVLLDLHAAVPLDGTGNFLPRDNLHLHWKGCVAAGEAFAGAIASALPLTGEGAITGAPDATVTSEAQTALGAANIAELANYRNGFTRVYAIEKTGAAGATNCFTTAAPYTAIEDYSAATRPVLRAGYYMELVRKGTNRRRYVWVDFDAEGKTLGDIDFPWQGENMNCTVEKLHVYSNDPSIHNIAANDDTATGAVEGTWHNYTGTDDDDGVPADVIAGAYGWNDTMGSGNAGYGCFQIHRIFSQTGDDVHWNDAETLFAWNRWGRAEQVDEIGIGSFAKSNTLGGNNFSMDYTFTAETADGAIDTLSSDAYSVRRLEIWAEFAGSPRHGAWSGTAGDGNFDTAANWEDGRVPSAGENVDFSALAADAAIAVAGVSSGQKFGAATMGAGVVTFTGDIAFSAISDTSKIAVGANSTVTLDGGLVFSGGEAKAKNYIVYTVAEGGKFAVTGDIVADTDFLGYVFHSYTAGGGAVQARGVANNATSNSDAWAFRLSANDGTAVANWIVGDHGLFGSKGLWTNGSYPVSLRPGGAGLVIAANVGINSACEFNTTGTDGNARTITIGDGTSGAFSRSGAMNVTGAGTLLVNSSSDATSPVSVAGGATLAIKAGKQLTTGAITVGGNATLSLPQTGTVMLGGDLELEDDAALEFSPSGVTDSTLAIASGKTLSLPESGTVTVKFASKALVKPGQSYTILAGAGLADASKFALESGDGGTLSVSGGDLVYTAPRYFMIRIADGDAEESIPVAWDWIVENGYGTPADTEAAVSTAIAESAANGLPAWQCYCLGLDPEDAASRIYCAKSADQTGVEAGSVRVAAANLNVPENPELAVSASLERSADLVNWEIADGPDEVPSGSVEFIATISENASVSYFRISAHIAAASGS